MTKGKSHMELIHNFSPLWLLNIHLLFHFDILLEKENHKKSLYLYLSY